MGPRCSEVPEVGSVVGVLLDMTNAKFWILRGKVKKLGIENENEKKRKAATEIKSNWSNVPVLPSGNTPAIHHSAQWLSIGLSVGYCGYLGI